MVKNLRNTKTESGKEVKKLNTKEFAKAILNNPDRVYSFTKTLCDSHEDPCKTIAPWPYYSVVNTRIIDENALYFHHSALCGENPVAFNIPSYDSDLEIYQQSEECLQEIIDGLKGFSQLHKNSTDTWYVTKDIGRLSINYLSIVS